MLDRIVSVSGGKDSTALYLMMVERSRPFRAVFADTQNEHEATYEFVRTLSAKTGGPEVEWVRADFTEAFRAKRARFYKRWRIYGIPEDIIDRAYNMLKPTGNVFVDACILRAGFPGAKHRFCTDMLKITPIVRQVYWPASAAGARIISYNGTRADESFSRSLLPFRTVQTLRKKPVCRVHIVRPLLDWSVGDVMDRHARHGIKPNPLYELGVGRVGCWPCIFAKKAELEIISKADPEKIALIREWEEILSKASKRGSATFFPPGRLNVPGEIHHTTHGIDERVKWAQTSRGGRQYKLFPEENENSVMEEFHTARNVWGTCE